MESLDTSVAVFMDDLLNFSSDIGEEEEEEDDDHHETTNRSLPFSIVPCTNPDAKTLSFPKYAEEELEWISNKDAFPMVESLVDIMLGSNHPSVASTNRLSPISVLENSSSSINSNGSNSKSGSSSGSIMSFSSSLKFPVRARSKPRRKRRRDMLGQQWQCWSQENSKANTKQGAVVTKVSSTMGRKCEHCQAEKTPQWRAGPMGPKTLCNACGVRYKSGRLVPEYRPASSPTFSSLLHSNSHRKVMEMRRKKQLPEMVLKPAEIG